MKINQNQLASDFNRDDRKFIFGQFIGEIRTYLDSHWLFASTRPEEPEPVFNINTAATVVPVLLDKQCKNTAEAM